VSTPESKVKDLIKRRFAEEFPDAYRFCPVQNGMGAPSLDVLYCIPHGIFVALEAKAPGKKPTDRQLLTMEAISAAGGLVYVVDGVASLEEALTDILDVCDHQCLS
jgi:hypothetical protein